ncbi:MAG: NAD-dependent epimerase/dehydratase family protein [Bacteroidota bacterium]
MNILITGALGQLGSELTEHLRQQFSPTQVLATDIREPNEDTDGPFEVLDVTDGKRMAELISKYKITHVLHLAAILSARGEQNPLQTWRINMDSWLNVLEVSRTSSVRKVYFPSSIAVFGADTPAQNTPQFTHLAPSTVYGMSKQAGEHWAQYYFKRYGLDVRSLRYPGLISYKSPPGGGTTDYAIDIFHAALKGETYSCFLKEDTYLPMMYMPDAVRATIELMEAPLDKISTHTGYNLGAMSFSPKEIFEEIKQHIPEFTVNYDPDFRQQIADTWPDSLDDSLARQDWGWKESFDLSKMTTDMLKNLKTRLPIGELA